MRAKQLYAQGIPEGSSYAAVASRSVPAKTETSHRPAESHPIMPPTSGTKGKRRPMSEGSDDEEQARQKSLKVASPENDPEYQTDMDYNDEDTSENNKVIRMQAIREYDNFRPAP